MFEGLFQPMHLLVILGIAVLVFGPRKLPELGKGLGDGIRGFRSALKDVEHPGGRKRAPRLRFTNLGITEPELPCVRFPPVLLASVPGYLCYALEEVSQNASSHRPI